MQIKPISSQETKDNPFEFSEHGAYLCAPQFWAVIPAQRCFTRYFCAATGSAMLYCRFASADKENKH